MKKVFLLALVAVCVLIIFPAGLLAETETEKRNVILDFQAPFSFNFSQDKEKFIKDCKIESCKMVSVSLFEEKSFISDVVIGSVLKLKIFSDYKKNNWNDLKLEKIEIIPIIDRNETPAIQVSLVAYAGNSATENEILLRDLERFIVAADKLINSILIKLFISGYSGFFIEKLETDNQEKAIKIQIKALYPDQEQKNNQKEKQKTKLKEIKM